MSLKNKKIIQCPYCKSNRLYLRRGLVSDALISLLTSVKSFTCGSCSRSFRKYNNYFTSKQALVHILIILAIIGMTNPDLINPKNWLMSETTTKTEQNHSQDKFEKEIKPVDMTLQDSEIFPTEEYSNAEIALKTNSTKNITIISNATLSSAFNATSEISNATKHDHNATLNGTVSRIVTMVNGTEMNFNATSISPNKTDAPRDIPLNNPKSALQSGKLNSIYFKDIDGKTRINLDLGGSPLSYTSFFLRNPDRLVVDIHGSWEYFGPTTLKPENPIFSKFRIGIYDDKLRMVMDLKGYTPAPSITKTNTGLNIDVK